MGYLQERGRDFGTLHGVGATADGYVGDLSVRNYPGVGWASYQSPQTDQVLRAIQAEAVRSGYAPGLSTDGVISDATVVALKVIAKMMLAKPNATATLVSSYGLVGNRIDLTARALLALASSPQLTAERGSVVYGYLKALNDATGRAIVPYPAARAAPPVPVANAAPPVAPLPMPGSTDLLALAKSPLGIAAIAVGSALVYVTFIKGGRRRRRS